MIIEKINICPKPKLITKNNLMPVSVENHQIKAKTDLFVKSNNNISFGEKSGVGGAVGIGVGAIVGVAAACVLTGGAASLAFLPALATAVGGSATVAGGMAAGGVIGDKIEDMVRGGK